MGLRLKQSFCARWRLHWWGKVQTGNWQGYDRWQTCRLCGARRPV